MRIDDLHGESAASGQHIDQPQHFAAAEDALRFHQARAARVELVLQHIGFERRGFGSLQTVSKRAKGTLTRCRRLSTSA